MRRVIVLTEDEIREVAGLSPALDLRMRAQAPGVFQSDQVSFEEVNYQTIWPVLDGSGGGFWLTTRYIWKLETQSDGQQRLIARTW